MNLVIFFSRGFGIKLSNYTLYSGNKSLISKLGLSFLPNDLGKPVGNRHHILNITPLYDLITTW